MLLATLDLLLSDPLRFLIVFPILLASVGSALMIGITVHEFSHALAAFRLGDLTAKRLGRLSLNPIRHLDPIGTALLVIVGFGWGKPVPVNSAALRRGRRGMAVVAAAGPLSNVVTAFLLSLPIKAGILKWPSSLFFNSPFELGIQGFVSHMIALTIFFNLILAVFNLLPFFPLDGSKVATGLLPRNMARTFMRLETYGPMILLIVIAVDIITDIGILRSTILPVVNYLGYVMVDQKFF